MNTKEGRTVENKYYGLANLRALEDENEMILEGYAKNLTNLRNQNLKNYMDIQK